ncbi:MAG: 5-formyltetrahydrofolate cyclo-ligase [Candidatus Thermoplasmatota archaeon]|nr:5-formyltetrahydrofolate cyclo-ligase [Candidatus Thermoplasmatota archaeon]
MKDEIRETIQQKRSRMSATEVLEKSQRIKDRFFRLDEFRDAQTMLWYVSYNNEVTTHEMIKDCMSMGKHVLVPKTDVENRTLRLCVLSQWEDLVPGAYGILEPWLECVREEPVDSIDVMIVPGVVFDEQGNRLGHGFGYYDRLLTTKGSRTVVVGLAFELQLVHRIPFEDHDVKVDQIVTEDRIITCSDI